MQRAKIRTWLVVVLAAVAAVSMLPKPWGSSHSSAPPAPRTKLTAKQGRSGGGIPASHRLPTPVPRSP